MSGPKLSGTVAQRRLFDWVVSSEPAPVSTENERLLAELRTMLQARLKQGRWELFASEPGSPADHAGMDYILLNIVDGRYFIFDATLNPRGKKDIATLRQEGVVELRLSGAERDDKLHAFYVMKFMKRMLDTIEGEHTPLNMTELRFPDTRACGDAAFITRELVEFQTRLHEKIAAMKELAETRRSQKLTRQEAEDVALLEEYSLDLVNSTKFHTREAAKLQDEDYPAKVAAVKVSLLRIIALLLKVGEANRSVAIVPRAVNRRRHLLHVIEKDERILFGKYPGYDLDVRQLLKKCLDEGLAVVSQESHKHLHTTKGLAAFRARLMRLLSIFTEDELLGGDLSQRLPAICMVADVTSVRSDQPAAPSTPTTQRIPQPTAQPQPTRAAAPAPKARWFPSDDMIKNLVGKKTAQA